MMDLLVSAVFVLAYGAMGSVLGLSATAWLRRREQKLFKILLFLTYLTALFLLNGLRFGLALAARDGGERIAFVFEILERAALASLIYFLPATINYILGRRWTRRRLVRVLAAASFYLVSGLISLFTGGSVLPGGMAVLAFLLIVLFILVDASRSLPMIEDEATRVALFLLYGLTFVFLPLVQVIPLMNPGAERTLFLAAAIYYLALGSCADVFFIRLLLRTGTGAAEDDGVQFTESCRFAGLTGRETQIAGLIARGSTYKEIAADLGISPNTVSNHVTTIYRKTGTRSKVEMVNALRRGHGAFTPG